MASGLYICGAGEGKSSEMGSMVGNSSVDSSVNCSVDTSVARLCVFSDGKLGNGLKVLRLNFQRIIIINKTISDNIKIIITANIDVSIPTPTVPSLLIIV